MNVPDMFWHCGICSFSTEDMYEFQSHILEVHGRNTPINGVSNIHLLNWLSCSLYHLALQITQAQILGTAYVPLQSSDALSQDMEVSTEPATSSPLSSPEDMTFLLRSSSPAYSDGSFTSKEDHDLVDSSDPDTLHAIIKVHGRAKTIDRKHILQDRIDTANRIILEEELDELLAFQEAMLVDGDDRNNDWSLEPEDLE